MIKVVRKRIGGEWVSEPTPPAKSRSKNKTKSKAVKDSEVSGKKQEG